MQIRRILVTTDFSDTSKQAFRSAAELAQTLGVPLDLVYVEEFPPPVETHTAVAEESTRQLRHQLRDLAGHAAFEGLDVSTQLLQGPGPEALEEFVRQGGHGLAVIASHGRTGLRHLLLGSFVERFVRIATCPVLVIRQGQADGLKIRRIVHPHDFSTAGLAAVDALRFFAERFRARVDVLHVISSDLIAPQDFDPSRGEPALPDAGWQSLRDTAERRLRDFVKERLSGVEAVVDVLRGNVVRRIVQHAEDIHADLIVLATHGRTGLHHAFIGSVAERVARTAPCAVLVVRPQGAPTAAT